MPRTIEELAQSRYSTPQFAEQFQADYNRAPTQQELQSFVSARPKTEVGMLDASSAVPVVNNQKGYLDTTYPQIPNATPDDVKTPAPIPTTGDSGKKEQLGKAYFVNQAGQEAEYTQEQLNDPNTQKFLKDSGYVLTKSDGVNVSDFSTSDIQKRVDQSNQQIESLTNEFLSWNVDGDPAFRAQANSIKSEFAQLREDMERTNFQRQRAFETLGYRTGATQYAQGIQMGIEGEELRQGSARISEIIRQEAAALSSARLAFETGKYNKFNQQVEALKDIRDAKEKELTNYNQKIVDFRNKLKEEQKDLFEREKFEFEVRKYEEEKAAKGGVDLGVIAPGSSLYDKATGKIIGTAPEPLDKKAPEIKMWGGKVHQWNPAKQSWETVGSEEGFDESEPNQEVIDWANQVANGTRKFSDVPEKLKTAVNSAISKLPPKQEDVSAVQGKLDKLDALLNHPGMDESVGTTKLSRFDWMPLTGAKSDFIAGIQELLSEKTLQALIDAKAEGATFGALSEGELKILQAAASRIGSWAIKDKNGNIKGYKTSEAAFKKELGRIKDEYSALLKTSAGQGAAVNSAQQRVDDFYLQNPAKREQLDSLRGQINPDTGTNFTDDEIIQYFGNDLGIPLTRAGSDASSAKLVSAIGQYESGGNYQARGKDGEIGKYQIMPGNYSAWAREAGVDPNDKSPQAQDKIAEYKINQYLQKYNGDPVAVAIAWNAGPGRANEYMKTGEVPGLKGTSLGGGAYNVPKYVDNVLANLRV